jgi:hypothetical protein
MGRDYNTSGDFPFPVVRLECTRCGRSGRYALSRLFERFGAEARSPDVLVDLAACERRRNFGASCGARYTDLVSPRLWEITK